MPDAVPALGAQLPDIPLTAADGRTSTLHGARADRHALVLFMRSSTCPVCHAHAREIIRLADAGELRGAAFLLIAPGDSGEARTVEDRLGSTMAEVWSSGDHHSDIGLGTFLRLQHSGSFVVDTDGRVLYARTSVLPTGSFARDEALAALAAATSPA